MSIAINFTADAIAYVGVALVFAVDGGVSAMVQAMVVDRAGSERLGAALATNAFVRDLFIGAVPLILGAIIQTAGFWGAGGFLAGARSSRRCWAGASATPRRVRGRDRLAWPRIPLHRKRKVCGDAKVTQRRDDFTKAISGASAGGHPGWGPSGAHRTT